MKSTILTKVSTVTPRNFYEQCEWMKGASDFEFLKQFVKLCHKNGDSIMVEPLGYINIHTAKASYRYVAFSKHIQRIDLVSQKRKFYKIS